MSVCLELKCVSDSVEQSFVGGGLVYPACPSGALRVCVVVGGHAVSLTLLSPHDTSCQLPGMHCAWLLTCLFFKHTCIVAFYVSVWYLWLFWETNHVGCSMRMGLRLLHICVSVVLSSFYQKRVVRVTFVSRWRHETPTNMPVSCELGKLIILKINCPRGEEPVRLPVIRPLSRSHASVTTATEKGQLGWNSNRKHSYHSSHISTFSPLVYLI